MMPDLIVPAWRRFWRSAFPLMRCCSDDELHRLSRAARMFAADLDRLAQQRRKGKAG